MFFQVPGVFPGGGGMLAVGIGSNIIFLLLIYLGFFCLFAYLFICLFMYLCVCLLI